MDHEDSDCPPTPPYGASGGGITMNANGPQNSDQSEDMFDVNILQKFSCMQTDDKEAMVQQLQRLLGDQVNPDMCAFFLDMNNWNVQAAVCSYFDYEMPKIELRLPSMTFIQDVTIGEGEEVPPKCRFTKTWRIQNSGSERWPPGCSLRFLAGDQMSSPERVIVDQLMPGQIADVSVDMLSPSSPGTYQGQWRMATAMGQYFGDMIWVIITVSEGGLLSLTQQMNAFHELGSPGKPAQQQSGGSGNGSFMGQKRCHSDPSSQLYAQGGSDQSSLNAGNNPFAFNSHHQGKPIPSSETHQDTTTMSSLLHQRLQGGGNSASKLIDSPVAPTNAINGINHLLRSYTSPHTHTNSSLSSFTSPGVSQNGPGIIPIVKVSLHEDSGMASSDSLFRETCLNNQGSNISNAASNTNSHHQDCEDSAMS